MAPSTPSRSASGQHDLLGGGRDQVDPVPGRPVQLHQLERLGVHDGLDRLEHGLPHDLADLGPVPPLGHGQHRLAHPGQSLLVGAEIEVDELGHGGPGHQPAVDQAAFQEGPTEGGDGCAVDDGLVQVEERRLHTSHATGERGPP